MSLKKTCQKLGVNFKEYVFDRLSAALDKLRQPIENRHRGDTIYFEIFQDVFFETRLEN